MDKIQTEEYVRTVDGKIGIFDRYSSRSETSIYKSPFDCFIRLKNRKTPLQCCRDYIVKHSKNIIDLIELGDYVNGMKVCKINEPSLVNDYKRIVYCNESEGLYEGIFTNDDIKSIVTKQQMEAIQYVVE